LSTRFSCAGKVFITGEYACLEGGAALVATIGPRFELAVERGDGTSPFADESPAGRLLRASAETTRGWSFEWRDPYSTPIGVGSSSAQFVLTLAAIARLRGVEPPSARHVLAMYWETVAASQGVRPSGVDVIAQWQGGPLLARNDPFETERLSEWRGDAAFVLAYTGAKAKTHEHLQELQRRGFPGAHKAAFSRLNAITGDAVLAWRAQDAANLGTALTRYQHALLDAGLAPSDFTALIDEVLNLPGVLGGKGSGAQGGDCVLLLVNGSELDRVSNALRQRGWLPQTIEWSAQGLSVSDV
jgi:mevalonate kinase